ncbi:MAG: TetR/AcrR family transcriptional regulator C-terminal domain-containing protein [Clostridia bacterium]|nr:TetR/AcrR family transcriptional regulator C-terminal domain-containing protein [Clostridia bacterium]
MRQKEEAKDRIARACLEMLKTTSLDALRAQDLMEKAGVSRSTFYRLFPDKYEVVNWIYKHKVDQIIKENPNLRDWKEWTVAVHAYMRQHKQFFRNIASYQGQNSFCEFLCGYFANNTLRTRNDPDAKVTEDQLYGIRAFSLIAAHATIDWILNDFKPDDATLIRRQELCIPEFIRHFYD